MTWHIQYRNDATDHIERHPSPERAIEAACCLMDEGYDVYGIGTVRETCPLVFETAVSLPQRAKIADSINDL